MPTETVVVRRQPGDWRSATYDADQAGGWRWDVMTGGIQRSTATPFLMCYVACDGMLEGELAHSGIHGACPHSIKVVVQQSDNPRALYRRLAQLAGPKPASAVRVRPHLERVAPRRYRVWWWERRRRCREYSEVMPRVQAWALMRALRKEVRD